MQYKNSPLNKFNTAYKSFSDLYAIYIFLKENHLDEMADDIVRHMVVSLVSAIDTYIHEVVVNSILYEITANSGIFDISKSYIPAHTLTAFIQGNSSLLEYHVRQYFSQYSFQSPDSIAGALSKIGILKIWTKVSDATNKDTATIKQCFKFLTDRRNAIAHESDLNEFGNKRDIAFCDFEELFNDAKDYIITLDSIYKGLFPA